MKKFTGMVASACMMLGLLCAPQAEAYEAIHGPTGLLVNKAEAYQGYTLFSPSLKSKTIYLMDMDGRVVHTWASPANVFYAELLDNGNVLASIRAKGTDKFNNGRGPWMFGGEHGRLIEMTWDGNIVFDVTHDTEKALLHHGFERMPNGNTLALIWEQKSWDEARAKGRKAEYIPDGPIGTVEGMWPDGIFEFDPSGKIVWEWHAWDHIGTAPNQLDINRGVLNEKSFSSVHAGPDWTHCNAVSYNEKTNQIALSSRDFGEVFIIDKKTGEIVWRWGNPANYGMGTDCAEYGDDGDQKLFGQHDVNWLKNGNLSIFDNGTQRPSGTYSRALELSPTKNRVVWEFALKGEQSTSFYTPYQGAAQKLPNGNYFVTATESGHIFEVTPTKEVVWEYVNPLFTDGTHIISRATDSGSNYVHRAFRYGADHPAFAGKKLVPGKKLNLGAPDWDKLMAPYIQ